MEGPVHEASGPNADAPRSPFAARLRTMDRFGTMSGARRGWV